MMAPSGLAGSAVSGSAESGTLIGWNILIPRGGEWGNVAADLVRAYGATPVIAPLIDFAEPHDQQAMAEGLRELADGGFNWLVVTSATTVRTLSGVSIPPSTRVAAVGPATAAALAEVGVPVDLVPAADFSAASLAGTLAAQLPSGDKIWRIFLPQSASADPALADGLRATGADVTAVAAYRTVSVSASPSVIARLRSGERWAILVTSGGVAREVAAQFVPVFSSAETPVLVCIGARTAKQAAALGLPVAAIATQQSTKSMLDSLIQFAKEHS